MRCYEHTLIARQDLSPQQAQTLAETYSGLVTENGGEVTKSEYWGLRTLTYRINKNRKGHYLHLNMRAPAAAVAELERQEGLNDDVLRYLTVRVDELDDAPSVVMQARSSREERSRRPYDAGPRRPQEDGGARADSETKAARRDSQSETKEAPAGAETKD